MGWAEGLQGAGAWFSGQGPQYEAVKAQDDALKDERRRKALITDLTRANYFVSNGEFGKAQQLFANRLDNLGTLNATDKTHTQELLRMSQDPARYEELKSELGSFVAAGIASGDIEASQASPYQFGAQETFADTSGNLFMGTMVNDPVTGKSTPSVVAVDGSGSQPQGQLRLVNSIGLTAGQIPGQAGAVAGAEAAARGQQEAIYAALIKMAEAQGANIGAKGGNGAPSDAQLAAEKAAAEAEAKASAEQQQKDKDESSTSNILEVAANQVLEAFKNVKTGPLVGRIPAGARDATAYQTAEAAAGNYRTQMRNIIRLPGSGPWTELDEQQLEAYTPNVRDTPEAVANKIKMGRELANARSGKTAGKTVVRRGVDQATGKRVVMYSDGTVEPE